MRTYFEPTMNISVFDKADVVTTSGPISDQMSGSSGNNIGTASYNDIKNDKVTSVSATMSN